MCIDDDALALKSLTVLLQTLGYSVDAIDDATIGLNQFDERNHALVITDMNMPEMNGLRLTHEIKKISPNTPVMVISGNPELNLDDQHENSQPDCILVKPLNFAEFTKQLNQLLGQSPC